MQAENQALLLNVSRPYGRAGLAAHQSYVFGLFTRPAAGYVRPSAAVSYDLFLALRDSMGVESPNGQAYYGGLFQSGAFPAPARGSTSSRLRALRSPKM